MLASCCLGLIVLVQRSDIGVTITKLVNLKRVSESAFSFSYHPTFFGDFNISFAVFLNTKTIFVVLVLITKMKYAILIMHSASEGAIPEKISTLQTTSCSL